MDQQPEMSVPAHVHGMWNVLSILFLVLFILSAVFNVFLFLSWSGQADVVEDLEEDIEELVLDEEVEDEILEGEAIKEDEFEEEDAKKLSEGIFDTSLISFDYPSDSTLITYDTDSGIGFDLTNSDAESPIELVEGEYWIVIRPIDDPLQHAVSFDIGIIEGVAIFTDYLSIVDGQSGAEQWYIITMTSGDVLARDLSPNGIQAFGGIMDSIGIRN